jgi:O-antigen/teichoic acid export membrane protein
MQIQRPGLLRNAFHLGAGQIVTTVVAIVFSSVVSRTLGAEEFGLLHLVMSIATFAYVFVDWGHAPYVTGQVARHPERSGEMLGTVLAVRIATAAVMCVLALTVMWIAGYEWRTRMLAGFMLLAFLPQYLGFAYGWVFRGRERMDYDAILQVVLKLSGLLITLACLALGGRLVSVIVVTAVAGAITCMVAVGLNRRLGSSSFRVDRSTARELVRGGAPMMAMTVAVAVQPYIDANLLYTLASASVVGWYGAAWMIAGTLIAPAVVIGSTMYPRLARVSGDVGEFRRVLRTAFRPLLLVAVLGGVGTVLFADFGVGVIYSQREYAPAGQILRSFAPALVLVYLDMLFGYALIARGQAGRLAKVKFAAVAVTTGVELALIPLFQARFANGAIGVMLGAACGELVMVLGTVLLLRDILERGMFADLARAAAAGALTIVVTSQVTAMPLVALPLCIALFIVFSAAVGLVKPADFELVSGALRKRRRGATGDVPDYPSTPDPVAARGR